jgi:putative ABC transport system permease protein
MSWTRFFRRRYWDEERARELEAYLEAETDENIARGMSPEEARYAAHRKLGNTTLIREEIYHMNSLGWLETLWQDLRFALRMLRKNSGFTAVVVLILALGVGASTAIFSIVYALAIRPLPYDHPEQLVVLWRTESLIAQWPVSGPDFLDWEKQSTAFSALAAFQHYRPVLQDSGQSEALQGYLVTPAFFKVLGVQAARGRLFEAGDEQAGRDHVVVLGAADQPREPRRISAALGKTLTLDNEDCAVVGSVPASFHLPAIIPGMTDPDIYLSFPHERLTKDRQDAGLFVIGRLKPGVTLRQAQVQMTAIASRLARQYPDSNAGTGIRVVSMQDLKGNLVAILGVALLFAVGFLLLIACVNVAVLVLTRGARRQREIAIRRAVGASPGRVARQLLTENLLLALAGGLAGVLLAFLFKDALLYVSPAALIPRSLPIQINGQVLAFALVLSMATGVFFGLVPALQLSRVSLEGFMKEGARAGGAGVRSVGFRDFLVVAEVTLALALLIVCGLMIRFLTGILVVRPGFNPRSMLTMSITTLDSKYPTYAARSAFGRDLTGQINALPGVESSALEGQSFGHVAALDKELTPATFKMGPFAYSSTVSPEYFRTLQLQVLRGRPLSAADYIEKPSVAVVNSALAKSLWPNQEALGKRFTVTYPPESCEVVGVAADASPFGESIPILQAYLPKWSTQADLLVRTRGNPKSEITPIRNLISRVYKDVRVSPIKTMEESRAQLSAPLRAVTFTLGAMSIVALLLATMGVYAVTAFAVIQRTHEIGVRMAMGARRSQVLIFVMRHGLTLSLLGIVIGLLLALGWFRVLAFFLHGVTVGDISTYLGVSLLLLLITILASYIPARRATRIDPMVALRCE